MKFRGARDFSNGFFHGGKDLGVSARDENVLARVSVSEHGADDFRDLLRGFALGEHDLGEALAQGTVMVHFGKAEILERQMLQALNGRARREFPGLHGFQNSQQFRLIHTIQPMRILSLASVFPAA